MQTNLAAMNSAFRVLTALTEKRDPDQADVATLEFIVGRRPEGQNLDEFACHAIKRFATDQIATKLFAR